MPALAKEHMAACSRAPEHQQVAGDFQGNPSRVRQPRLLLAWLLQMMRNEWLVRAVAVGSCMEACLSLDFMAAEQRGPPGGGKPRIPWIQCLWFSCRVLR